MKIDQEFEKRIPPLTAEEFRQLEENILEDGIIYTPILVWDDVIIDGHNRYRILLKHPEIPYSVREIYFENRNEALSWICENQLGRRNLTPAQKKVLIGTRYEAEKASHGGNRKKKSSDQNEHLKKENTRKRLAREMGVSESHIQRCINYTNGIEEGDRVCPGFRDLIFSGKKKLKDKDIEEIVKIPEEERESYVKAVIQDAGKKKAKKLPDTRTDDILPELHSALDQFIWRWEHVMEGHENWGRNIDNRAEVNGMLGHCRLFLDEFQDQYFSGPYTV